MDDENFLILCLLNIKGLGYKKTLHYMGDPHAALALIRASGEQDAVQKSAEKEIQLARRLNIQLINFKSRLYPSSFKKIADPPPLLYVAGSLEDEMSGIALIGTRQATSYGLEMASHFAERLATHHFPIISGLARGIDTAAHLGALKGGKSVAILGSGLSHIYPAENGELARKIASGKGAVISEFPLTTPPHPYNFPKRNRLVSGLSQALLLIEASLKSGAMLTMKLGKEQGRPLFAIPGRADSVNFRGNHALIKQSLARLVETPEEVSELLGKPVSVKPFPLQLEQKNNEEPALAYFQDEEISFDVLSLKTGYCSKTLNALLMRLMLKGLIRELPGKKYRRVSLSIQ